MRRTERVHPYGSAADACKVLRMGRKVDVDDLIDTHTVAKILGLAHRNTVSE